MSSLLAMKWEYPTLPGGAINQTLNFAGAYTVETVDPGALESRIASANAGAGDGDFDELGRDDSRLITITGKILGDCSASDPYADARSKWDALGRALLRGQRGKLWRYSDRYWKCQIKTRKRDTPDDGIDYIPWSAVFRAADPYLWEADYQPILVLPTTDGTTAIDTACSAPCLPIFTINFTTAGTVTFSHAGQTLSITTTTTGLYILDCETARATGPAGDATVLVAGQWIQLHPSASTIVVAYSGGAVSSGTSVRYVRRWLE